MGRFSGSITFGSSFNIATSRPIDSRMRVEHESDLTTGSTWPASEAPVYKGMLVTVMDTGDVWVLMDATGYTSINSWKKLGDFIKDDLIGTGTTYSSQKIRELIGSAGFAVEIVDSLPDTGDSKTIYFLPTEGEGGSTTYTEWMYIENGADWEWVQIGDTEIDLSDYYTKEEVDDFIDAKQDNLTASSGINITLDNKISSNSNATTVEEIQLSNGAPVTALGVWPNNKIPSGTSIQDILVKLLCKEIYPSGATIPYISVNGSNLGLYVFGSTVTLTTPSQTYESGNFNSNWGGDPSQPGVEGVNWTNTGVSMSIVSGFTNIEGQGRAVKLGTNSAKYTYTGDYSRPSNMPITNLSNETLSTTGITTSWTGGDLSAVWESGSTTVDRYITATGVYPCFHNANTGSTTGLGTGVTYQCGLITGKTIEIETGKANEVDSQRKFMFEFPSGTGATTTSKVDRKVDKFEVYNELAKKYDDVTTNVESITGKKHTFNGNTYYYTRVQRTTPFDSATKFRITLSKNLNS